MLRWPGVFVRLPPVPGVEEVLFDLGKSGPEVVVLGVVLCPGAVLTRLGPRLCTCTGSITYLMVKSCPG